MLRAFARIYAVFSIVVAPAAAKPFDYLKQIRGRGPSSKAIGGDPWKEQAGQPVHHPASENEVDKQVREEEEARAKEAAKNHVPVAVPKIRAPLGIDDARAMAHLRKIVHGQGAPAPGPAPGPAPWTEDPEWMVDGARGDKTRNIPITDQFQGLSSVPLPEQGFHGRPIQHTDMDTMVGDFGREFGPQGPDNACEVCKNNPASYWCKQHMKTLCLHAPPKQKMPYSGTRDLLSSAFPTAALLCLWALIH